MGYSHRLAQIPNCLRVVGKFEENLILKGDIEEMEVVRRGKDRCVFADINVGECFEVADSDLNTVYMKIAVDTKGLLCVKAVDITDGYVAEFIGKDTQVIPIRATVSIEQ